MAIQMRQGNEVDFDAEKMLPGEWAVSTDARIVRMCFAHGVVVRMATYEAFEADMGEIRNILAECQTIEEAVTRINEEVNANAELVVEYTAKAKEYMEQAAAYAKQAETASGIHIASKEIAGVIKPGDFKVEEDGTVWMIKTVTGESMVLNDSVAGGLKIDRICGGSKQEKTSGKNLAYLEQGTLNINSGEEQQSDTRIRTNFIKVTPNEKYIASSENNLLSIRNGICYGKNKEYLRSSVFPHATTGQFTAPADVYYVRFIYSAVDTNLSLTPEYAWYQFEYGDVATAYEPHTNGPSPNPEYPQPIVSAGQKLVDGVVTDVGISKKLTGKNLLKNTAKSQTVEGVTLTVNEDGSIKVSGTATTLFLRNVGTVDLKGGESYILSGDLLTLRNSAGDMVYAEPENIYTPTEDITVYCKLRIGSGETYTNKVVYPMIRLASIEDDTYEPYTEQTLTLNRVLRGIPVTDSSLATYTDENGQMWCADYGDVERKIWVQRVGTHQINSLNGLDSSGKLFASGDVGEMLKYEVAQKAASVICDKFLPLSLDAARKSEYGIAVYGRAFYIANKEWNFDVSTANASLSDNPITVYYPLATPIETPMTDEEIIALHQLKTYQGVTHIFGSNDPDAGMIFKYSSSEIGGVTLENSNLHAVNEVLRRQLEAKDAELSGQIEILETKNEELQSQVDNLNNSLLPICNNAGFHNSIYRGKDLTNIYTIDEISDRIKAGTFDDLFVGDYIKKTITTEIGGTETVTLVFADFDTFYLNGDTETTEHHATMVLKDCFQTIACMNESDTTEGGYAGSKMFTEILPIYAAALQTACNNHILTHEELLSSSISEDLPSKSGAGWYGASNDWSVVEVQLSLMSEIQLYGSTLLGSSIYDIGNRNMQFNLFRHNPESTIAGLGHNGGRIQYWLSSVSSSTEFAFCYYGLYDIGVGYASALSGVRPYFLLS